jgi:uncharacterized protein
MTPSTPSDLIAAVKAGEADSVVALLARDPSLAGARDEQGLSAVMLALYHRHDAVREALLAAEPQLDVLEAAALGRADRLRQHLAADPGAVGARSPEGFTPLHYAAFFGGAGAVTALLEAGAPPDGDADNPLHVRPLHSAVALGDRGAVEALLRAGADPNVRQQGGITPLHAAAHADDAELVRMLLDHGADPSAAADDGRDPAAMAGERTTPLL